MGTKARVFAPLPPVSLEDLVPPEHVYRHLARSLGLSCVRDLVRDAYPARGRPSIDPVVFFKLQLVLLFEGIRSERRLLRAVADRLGLRWYLGCDPTEPLPDHASLTRIRDRYGLDLVRRFCEAITEQCRRAGLVWGRELDLGSTKVEADAALESLRPRFAVEARLRRRFAATDEAARPGPAQDLQAPEPDDAAPAPVALPAPLTGAARAALAGRAASRHDRVGEAGRPDRGETSGAYRRPADYRVSPTDPDAPPVPLGPGRTRLGDHGHCVVGGAEARIIPTALATPAEVQGNQPALDLLWRARFRWELRPRQATGDAKYGTVENIVALEDERVLAYVPLSAAGQRAGVFGEQNVRHDAAADAYHCPGGTVMRFLSQSGATRRRIHRAPAPACAACALRAQGTTAPRGRRVGRSRDEAYRDRGRGYRATEPYAEAMRKRRVWVGPLFAAAKGWRGLRRFRLRGPEKVNGEALLIAAGQTPKRPLGWRGRGRRPFPSGAAGALRPVLSPLAALPPRPHRPTGPTASRGPRRSAHLPFSTGWAVSETGKR